MMPSNHKWPDGVTALTPDHQSKLAAWRGYSLEFLVYLCDNNLIGLFDGERIALPVHDDEGNIVACHYRLKEDGTWRYFPSGTRTRPLVIGSVKSAMQVFAFESQWDAYAVMDKLGWHVDGDVPDTAVVITRGAGNGRLIANLCRSDATVFAFVQNDQPRDDSTLSPAEKWLSEVSASCGCKCVRVDTPPQYKDANDWTLGGATGDNLRSAITSARLAAALPQVNVQGALSPHVSASKALDFGLGADDESSPAQFPVDALPPSMAALATGVARTARVPTRLTGPCVLGLVSAAIGAGLEIQSDAQRTTRGNLFLLVSAETGTGKSRTFELIAAPFLDYQERAQEKWRKEIAPRVQSDLKILERELASLEKKAARATDPDERERLRGQHEYKTAEKEQLAARNIPPVLLVQDVTTERLTAMLAEQGEVLFSASSDCRQVISVVLGLYVSGEQTDEAVYLAGYSGDHVRVDRGSRPAVYLRRPTLGLLWFGQPDLLETMLSHDSLSASGFLPRMLLCHSNAVPQRIESEPEPLSETTTSRWANLLLELLSSFHKTGAHHIIQPTPEARQCFVDYHNDIVERRLSDLRDVTGFAARWCENAWRIAVVLHAGLHGAGAASQQLALETAQNAVRIAQWFADEQLNILAKGRRQLQEKVEDEVFALIERRQERGAKDYITARDVHNARIVSTADAARALVARMEADGLLVGEAVRPERGGRATRIYRAASRNPVPA